MEDQRNWSDGSFKTYCTPQELGYPFDARAGDRFRQKVTIEVTNRPRGRSAPPPKPLGHRVELDSGRRQPRPPIGFSLPREVDGHSEAEIELLRLARPGHLRVDLNLAGDGWVGRLAGARSTAGALGCPLEIAAFARSEAHIGGLLEELTGLTVARLLLFGVGEELSDPALTGYARKRARTLGLGLPVIGGTDLWFAELNRDRPDVTAMDGLVYSITPQVHTFDEESIAQSLEAQPDTVRTGISFAGGLPLHVSPVTLRPRDAIDVEPVKPNGGEALPFAVDPRQSSLFAAAWTVGSVAALAEPGAATLTYYETVGSRGIIPGDRPLPASFVGPPPGGAFAMFHVFADILEMGDDATLVRCRSGRPSEVATLALSDGGRLRVLVANLTATPVGVRVAGIPAGSVSVRMLDETSANQALADPRSFRSGADPEVACGEDGARVDLAPFALARLDAGGAR
jgi:D-apionolactonase